MNTYIRLHAADDVLIARAQLLGGTVIEGIAVKGLIPPGHKIATHAIAKGDPVHRYNQIIGFASRTSRPGEHVHTHNLEMGQRRVCARLRLWCRCANPTAHVAQPATFMGIVRPDGRVATRNYIGILTSVNCSATAARAIADYFRPTRIRGAGRFPNVDGVVALTHGTGCGIERQGAGHRHPAAHPGRLRPPRQLCGALMVGLGCEANQIKPARAAAA